MAFTPEQKALCVKMVEDGYNCKAIKEATGFTVGQISGFARRAGLTMRDVKKANALKNLPKIEHRPRVHIEPIPIRKKLVAPKPVETRIGSDKPVTIMELTSNHCRWMIDDTHYCGALTIVKAKLTWYCAKHYKIMYRPITKEYK